MKNRPANCPTIRFKSIQVHQFNCKAELGWLTLQTLKYKILLTSQSLKSIIQLKLSWL
jgi:hypothetical protein